MPKFQDTPEEFLNKILLSIKGTTTKIDSNKIDFVEEFKKDAGVWEGYTLREHIIFVLTQFSKYDAFDGVMLPTHIDKNIFRTMLVFHDLGKPYAISLGDKRLQGSYNKLFLEKAQSKISSQNIKLFAELVSEDTLGKYIKQEYDLNQTFSSIATHAKNCNTPIKEYYTLLKIYYMCDASSYTKDAGGQESLDWLFAFNHHNRIISFSEKVAPRMDLLNKMIIKNRKVSELI
jgi:hypothetical protein